MDVWGPYQVKTISGCKYFLTLVDDFSMAIWTFLIPSKQEVFQKSRTFVSYIHNHFHTTIKNVRTYNGSEFVNRQVHHFLSGLGILHQSSCTYTPQ